MKYMLYCIFPSENHQTAPPLLGAEAQPVQTITKNGLSGVYSPHEYTPSAEDRSNLLAYKKVVESFHQHHTVIPLRYGTVFHNPDQITRMLANQGITLQRLLGRLDSCVEMGVRILLPCVDVAPKSPDSKNAESGSQSPGKAYLSRRKLLYNEEAQADRRMKAVAAACREWFQGLFTAFREEFKPPAISETIRFSRFGENRIFEEKSVEGFVSLYFLIPHKYEESFKKRFHEFTQQRPERFLLSGPWPPYNFVV